MQKGVTRVSAGVTTLSNYYKVSDEQIKTLAMAYPWPYEDVEAVVRTWQKCRSFTVIVMALDFIAQKGCMIAHVHHILSEVSSDSWYNPEWLKT